MHYIYTALKYLNRLANFLHIQNLTVTKNASILSASNLSPSFSNLAAALTASWKKKIEKNVSEPNKLMETVEH